jgi:hypothetical protein
MISIVYVIFAHQLSSVCVMSIMGGVTYYTTMGKGNRGLHGNHACWSLPVCDKNVNNMESVPFLWLWSRLSTIVWSTINTVLFKLTMIWFLKQFNHGAIASLTISWGACSATSVRIATAVWLRESTYVTTSCIDGKIHIVFVVIIQRCGHELYHA